MAFVCRYCGVSKNTPGALQRHEASHRQPSHMCDICGKYYKRKDTRTRHNSVIHESKSKYKCEEHKLIFSSSAHQRETWNRNMVMKNHTSAIDVEMDLHPSEALIIILHIMYVRSNLNVEFVVKNLNAGRTSHNTCYVTKHLSMCE